MISELVLNAAAGGVLGLLIGSFLNVVIHRLPLMMEQEWHAEGAQWAEEQKDKGARIELPPAKPAITLSQPRSRCPHCGHQIAWYENIPVLSYLFLRGRCAECKKPISLRYPVVELVCAALFAFCLGRDGLTATGFAWCGFSAALLALALIDWDTTFLPDSITLPLLWAGLIASALQWTSVPLQQSLWGAVAGYMSLWLIFWAFKLATGKEGMGYGDFKLFAALGAWFGWQALVPIILMASVVGAVIGIALKINSKLREGGYVPFGPFLAGGGFVSLIWGPQAVLSFAGL
ncbi:A24 family peptidase [Comamonas thiooxydans]|uniref:prepilin peptidase n=1 Tax=Comamonas thiooxydans TaxID=363952 RepID=UPI001CCC50BE|nr:A24 family peptidase [Comamonas thiooxydans]MCO8247515.1 A24 family peptidase [Comamonas thiooxydans]MDH1473883.1 A24 family peptidase [Comamonas thiooxydans]UBQ42679.1 A24 family peptidase [Comamonas thiooxydans]